MTYRCVFPVPAIQQEPVDMTLEYRDGLTATFTFTAFGGDGAMLIFDWSASDSDAGLNLDSENETTNINGSITSTIATNTLTLRDRESRFTCEVRYIMTTSPVRTTATLNIGKRIAALLIELSAHNKYISSQYLL